MGAEKYVEECFKYCCSQPKSWNYETGVMLSGAMNMYEATGEEKYFSWIESCLASLMTKEGVIADYPEDRENLGSISCGRILYDMYDKTKDEKYRKAIDFIMDKLQECPRCKCGNFRYYQEDPGEAWLDALYMTQPFYMEYETKYDKKEKYNDIINQFENIWKFLYNEKKELCIHDIGLKGMGRYLAALIDAMDNMSFEIYEQYRKLQDAFKLTLKNMLTPEAAGNAMISYCIMKACRMGILLKEKYAFSGMKMMENLTEEEFMGDAENAGIFMMAYAQYVMLKKEMDVNG